MLRHRGRKVIKKTYLIDAGSGVIDNRVNLRITQTTTNVFQVGGQVVNLKPASLGLPEIGLKVLLDQSKPLLCFFEHLAPWLEFGHPLLQGCAVLQGLVHIVVEGLMFPRVIFSFTFEVVHHLPCTCLEHLVIWGGREGF